MLVSVAKAVAGGAAAAFIVAGTMKLGQKFPMTKGKAVALQGAGAVVGGSVLAALGAPGAGAVVAATLTSTAIATAQTPTVADTSKTSGVLPQRQGHVAGLLPRDGQTEYDRATMVSGILTRRRQDMAR